MAGPGRLLRVIGRRLGPRGTALTVLAALLLVMVAPLVLLPAVRCEVFGIGCHRGTFPAPAPRPLGDRTRPLSPLQVATQGRYVALGDSYSSGEGGYSIAADRDPANRCHRTSASYYHAVAKAYPFARGSEFWACAGSTSGQVLRGKSGEPPQVGRVDTGTSLVTISIGGNDLGFSKVLVGCVVRLPWSDKCTEQGPEIANRMAYLRRSLTTVLEQITTRAPYARVIVLGYPRMFSETKGSAFDNLSVSDQRWLNGQGYTLNELIRQISQEADQRIATSGRQGSVEFIDVYSAFAGHEIGSRDPYINKLDVNLGALAAEPRSFHPTIAGYRRLGELVVAQIKEGPGRAINQYR
ncbi:SGNH/GDSL hydrolase family protein [Actinomadura craniellae]|uniref:SGNH/GDSL hydrolase family protein n=1 Tax=Actinomadura craniellae TaxID=2231787 RepID=A0A365HDU3_9ACTN|nr:SGNH/GDSL hydrolase family protein [Actinomadura craniellae]RAY16423.1 SGNH/GDSL hydrolase family protein [Actinomadura craniellae]